MPTPASIILDKAILPTHLSSKEMREQISAEILQRSITSAHTTQAGYLQRLKELLADYAAGKINQGEFVMKAQRYLDSIGYAPEVQGAERHSIQDLASEKRLKLILDTNIKQAQSVARMKASEDPAIANSWPAWELLRVGSRMVPRIDWWQRWQDAGNSVSWAGASRTQTIALKSSPIWAAIGKGVGGYTDTLGMDYPPFAFNSGLGWHDVDRAMAIRLGLMAEDEQITLPAASLAPNANEYQAAYDRLSPDLQAQVRAFVEGHA